MLGARIGRGVTRRATESLEQVSAPTELESALRSTYPNCVVRPREISSEARVHRYVYRDGGWTPSVQPEGG